MGSMNKLPTVMPFSTLRAKECQTSIVNALQAGKAFEK